MGEVGCQQATESRAEFDARIEREDIEAAAVPCPVETCRALVGQPCKTEDGLERLRHARRLWKVRRENGN